MQKIRSNIDWIVFSGLIIIILLQYGCNKLDRNKLVENMAHYTDSTSQYIMALKKGDSVRVATNEVLSLENDKQVKAIAGKNDTINKLFAQFKKVRAAIIVSSSATVTGVSIPATGRADTVKTEGDLCEFEVLNYNLETADLKMDANAYHDRLEIVNMELPNKQTIAIGDKKTGFLKRTETIDLVNSNNYFKTYDLKAYTVSEKKWYDNKWVWFVGGFAIGATGIIVATH